MIQCIQAQPAGAAKENPTDHDQIKHMRGELKVQDAFGMVGILLSRGNHILSLSLSIFDKYNGRTARSSP